ncbi:MAG: glycosyltransferase family 4 protein [Bacteroidota bacterium]
MASQSKNNRRTRKNVKVKGIEYHPSIRKITVGIIIDTGFRIPPLTGVTYRLYYLSKAIQKHGHNVKIFICNRNIFKDNDIRRHIDDSELEIHIIPEKVFYNINQMLDVIKKNNIDVVQVEDIQSAMIFSKITTVLGIPLITELHDIEATLKSHLHYNSKDIRKSLKYTKLACDASDSLVCMTKFDNSELLDKIGIKKDKITLLPNPIDTKAFPYVGPALAIKKIIFIGNMYYPPNMRAACTIVEKISKNVLKDFKNIHFELAGMVPKNLKSKLQNKHVKFAGAVKDLTSFLSKATIALCPVTEGSGMKVKILNYCAAGIPIITTNLGRSGFEPIKSLIVEDNIEKYPNIIKKLLTNNERILTISKQIRRQVMEHYDIDFIAKKVIKLYRKTLRIHQDSNKNDFNITKSKLKLLWHSEKRIKHFSNPHYYVIKNGKIFTKKKFD